MTKNNNNNNNNKERQLNKKGVGEREEGAHKKRIGGSAHLHRLTSMTL